MLTTAALLSLCHGAMQSHLALDLVRHDATRYVRDVLYDLSARDRGFGQSAVLPLAASAY